MPKSAVNLLATNKQFKNGVITGLLLAKKIKDDNKRKLKGGKISLKKVLAIAAGPLGWVWLARHKNDDEMNELKKKLEKYESTPSSENKPAPKKVPQEEKKDKDMNDMNDMKDMEFDLEDFD